MNAATNAMESRENMILKMIRTFNAGIVRFVMGIRFRAIGATMLAFGVIMLLLVKRPKKQGK